MLLSAIGIAILVQRPAALLPNDAGGVAPGPRRGTAGSPASAHDDRLSLMQVRLESGQPHKKGAKKHHHHKHRPASTEPPPPNNALYAAPRTGAPSAPPAARNSTTSLAGAGTLDPPRDGVSAFRSDVVMWERLPSITFHPAWVGCAVSTESMDGNDFPVKVQGRNFDTDSCMAACLHEDRVYFAVRNFGDCYCGGPARTHAEFYSQYSDIQCGKICPSEVDKHPTRYCGDAIKKAVYKIQALDANWTGCYRDDVKDRDFAMQAEGDNFTSKTCMQYCYSLGYTYMALQDSGLKCFCGSSYSRVPARHYRVNDTMCGPPCKGEEGTLPARRCGQSQHNAVYKMKETILHGASDVMAAAAQVIKAAAVKRQGGGTKGNTSTISYKLGKFDLNSNDIITKDELARGLKTLNPVKWTNASVKTILESLDKDRDGMLQHDEFAAWIKRNDLRDLRNVSIPAAASLGRPAVKKKATKGPGSGSAPRSTPAGVGNSSLLSAGSAAPSGPGSGPAPPSTPARVGNSSLLSAGSAAPSAGNSSLPSAGSAGNSSLPSAGSVSNRSLPSAEPVMLSVANASRGNSSVNATPAAAPAAGQCVDKEHTGMKYHGAQASCAKLKLLCNSTKFGRKVQAACPASCNVTCTGHATNRSGDSEPATKT